MPFTINVYGVEPYICNDGSTRENRKLYEQTVEELDMIKVIKAVNNIESFRQEDKKKDA